MSRLFAPTLVALSLAALLTLPACSDSSSPEPGIDALDQLETDATDFNDITAHEIRDFELLESQYCVGQERADSFADYNYQCESVKGQGLCISMPNPNLGNTYYCALCGLKGDQMVCYMINPE